MKKRFLSLLLSLLLLTVSALPALATEGEEEKNELEAAFEELAASVPRYTTIALGYKNTVTGEEHYFNADKYIVGASLYKTPLNMIFAERVARGELSYEDRYGNNSYGDLQSASLTFSSNPASVVLLDQVGDFYGMRKLCAEYLGADAEDKDYLSRSNRFSVREMVCCMNLLETQKERFPGVLDCLLLSAPHKFLKCQDPPYEIAQKYGNLDSFFHAAGIIYTEEPIAVCIMTDGHCDHTELFTGFVRAITEYTEKQISQRKKEAAEAAEQARMAEEARMEAERIAALEEQQRIAQEEAAAAEAMRLAEENARKEKQKTLTTLIFLAALVVVLLLLLLRKGRGMKLLLPLFLMALLLLTLDGTGSGNLSESGSLSGRSGQLLEQARAEELSGYMNVVFHYRLSEDATAGSKPLTDGYREFASYADFAPMIEENRALLGDDTLLLTADTALNPGSAIRAYADETIFAVTWQEVRVNSAEMDCVATFAEVKVADGSQLRRKLGDDTYGSSIQKYPTELAKEANAVLAINADFYRFQKTGIHVYNRQVYTWESRKTDTCFVDGNGDLLFVYAGTLKNKAAVEEYVQENDVLFGVSFGPAMIENGRDVGVLYYWLGQPRDVYPRCALIQQGKLHYAAMTVHPGCTVKEATRWLLEKGVQKAYAMDGGQSAVIILGNELCNPMTQYQGSERTMSDILYFASALPEGES